MNEAQEGSPDFMFSFQFVTTVVSCCPAELKQEVDGKTEILKGFNVKLQDTILFPEGGGQVWAALENPYLSTPYIYIYFTGPL